MNKRGFSAIIVSIILILLVMVATFALWVVVKDTLSKSSEDITSERYTADFEIKSVSEGNGEIYVVVKRNPGAGEIAGLNFVVYDDTGKSTVIPITDSEATGMKELEEKIFSLSYSGSFTKVSVVPILKTKSGGELLGDNIDTLKKDGDTSGCVENWNCNGWSACSGGIQTRICTDSNNCGTTTNKPPETQSCGGAEYTILSTHPRIYINSNNLQSIKNKVLSGGALNSEYNTFKSRVNSNGKNGWDYVDANPDLQAALTSATSFIYLMEDDIAWTTSPKQAALTPHYFGWGNDDGGHYLEMYAIAYDWLYNKLSTAEKQTIRDNIVSIADSFLTNYASEIKLDDYHNYMTQWANGLMTAGLAIYDEDPVRGKQYIDFAREILYTGHSFTNVNGEPTVWNFKESVDYSNGYCDFEGLGYFANAIPEIAKAIEAFSTATDQNNIWQTEFSQMKNSAYYIMYGFTPNNNKAKFEDIDPTSTYVSGKYFPLLTLIENRFNEGYVKSFIDEKSPGVTDWGSWDASRKVHYFIFYNPAVSSTDYKTLDIDKQADNYYFMKSGWGAGNKYITFKAGTHYGYHSHSTHNGFFIWYKGNILTAEGGMYSSGCGTFDNPAKNLRAYNSQTVASNAITIYDSNDKYYWNPSQSSYYPNAGGQRMPYIRLNPPKSVNEGWSNMPWSGYMIKNNAETAETFKFANVKAWEYSNNYAYVRSDATKAYSNAYSGQGNNPNNKVNLVEREFVYVKPDYVVIYDRVEAKSPTYTKSFILHSVGAPSVSGSTPSAGITDYISASDAYMDTGTSRLFMKTLLPSSNMKYHVIGGSGYENYIESTSTNYAPDCAMQDYNMRWRIEVQPTDSANNHYFLNILYITDNAVSSMPATSLISSTAGQETKGSLIDVSGGNNKVVMFSKIDQEITSTTFTIPVAGQADFLITDLMPSTNYYYKITGQTIEISTTNNGGTMQQSSSEGTIYFTANIS